MSGWVVKISHGVISLTSFFLAGLGEAGFAGASSDVGFDCLPRLLMLDFAMVGMVQSEGITERLDG